MLPNQSDPASYGMPSGGWNNGDPVVDPTTDVDAKNGGNDAFADIAYMTHTAKRAWCRIVLGTSPTLASPNGHEAVWGTSVPPGPAHSGTGQYTITWPVSITDILGNAYNVNLRNARASVEGSTLGFAQASVTSANVVTVYTFNAAGAANDLTGITIFVEAG